MSRAMSVVCLPVALLCACASTQDDAARAVPAVPRVESGTPASDAAPSESGGVPSTTVVEDSAADEVEENGLRHLAPAELALWNDPDFQREFVESYKAVSDIEPRLTSVEIGHVQKVLDLQAADEQDEALALLEKHRGEAASAVFDYIVGNIWFERVEYDRAAEAYEVAVDKEPRYRRAWKNLGLIRVRQGDYDRGLEALTHVIELGGVDAVTYGLLGFAYLNVENAVSAESAYRMANLLEPSSLDWQLGLARSLFKQERFADAASLCETLIARHPEQSDLWLLQANAYIGLERLLDAAEDFEFVDKLGRSSVASLNTLGDIYVHAELFEMAVDAYVRALALEGSHDVRRPLQAAQVLAVRGATDETARLLDAIESAEGDALDVGERKDVLKLRSRLAVARGAGDEEVAVLQEILDLDPLDGDALLLLGDHAKTLGDAEQAGFYYERAAALPDFEADANVRHAQLLVGQGKYAEALPMLRRAQTLQPRQSVQDYLDQVERRAKSG